MSGWLRSSGSSGEDAVEVSFQDGGVVIRNSSAPETPLMAFTPDEWEAFTGGVMNGEFDDFGETSGS